MDEMQEFKLERDGEKTLAFTGELLAEVSSRTYSGETQNRWTEIKLYRTKAGVLVVQEVGNTTWQGEHDRHSATICDDEDAVIACLGYGWLAKRLYEKSSISYEERIE